MDIATFSLAMRDLRRQLGCHIFGIFTDTTFLAPYRKNLDVRSFARVSRLARTLYNAKPTSSFAHVVCEAAKTIISAPRLAPRSGQSSTRKQAPANIIAQPLIPTTYSLPTIMTQNLITSTRTHTAAVKTPLPPLHSDSSSLIGNGYGSREPLLDFNENDKQVIPAPIMAADPWNVESNRLTWTTHAGSGTFIEKPKADPFAIKLQWAPSSAPRDVIVITNSDYQPLLESAGQSAWLNDVIINFGISYLLDTIDFNESALRRDDIAIFSSFFFENLQMGADGDDSQWKGYERAAKFTNGDDYWEKRMIFIPICLNFHWFLAIIINPSGGLKHADIVKSKRTSILILDSLPTPNQPSCQRPDVESLLTKWHSRSRAEHSTGSRPYYSDTALPPTIHYMQTPKQSNTHDCGIFLLHFVDVMMSDDGGVLKGFFRFGRQREAYDPQAWREEEALRGRRDWQQRISALPPPSSPIKARTAEKRVRFEGDEKPSKRLRI